MKSRFVRAGLVLGLLGLVSMMMINIPVSGQEKKEAKASAPAAAKQTPPAEKRADHPHGKVEMAECTQAVAGAGAKADYEQVDAKECREAWHKRAPDAIFDVDKFIADPANHLPVYLHYGGGPDRVTYVTHQDGRSIKIARYRSNGQGGLKDGDPFAARPPYGSAKRHMRGMPDKLVKSPSLDLSRTPPAGSCWVFRAYILVEDQKDAKDVKKGKDAACYDPHIYTSCDPTCDMPPSDSGSGVN